MEAFSKTLENIFQLFMKHPIHMTVYQYLFWSVYWITWRMYFLCLMNRRYDFSLENKETTAQDPPGNSSSKRKKMHKHTNSIKGVLKKPKVTKEERKKDVAITRCNKKNTANPPCPQNWRLPLGSEYRFDFYLWFVSPMQKSNCVLLRHPHWEFCTNHFQIFINSSLSIDDFANSSSPSDLGHNFAHNSPDDQGNSPESKSPPTKRKEGGEPVLSAPDQFCQYLLVQTVYRPNQSK